MASKARSPFKPEIDSSMKSNRVVRPKIFFGNPMDYVREWAQQNGTLPIGMDNSVYLTKPQTAVSKATKELALVLSPESGGLVGFPQQTQDGVNFTCLLNPLITIFFPPMLIKLDNSLIRQIAFSYGSASVSRLDQNYTYRVIGVTHEGDTRGNKWYSNVVGANQDMEGLRPAMFETEQDTVE